MINTSHSATTTAANTTAVGIQETAALVCSVDLILATSLTAVPSLQAQTQTIPNVSVNVIVNVLDRTVRASVILARTDTPHLSAARIIARRMTAMMVASTTEEDVAEDLNTAARSANTTSVTPTTVQPLGPDHPSSASITSAF
ncbi:hypothetical protein FPHYL_6417 [Fusarium phyllophilum]|uniref:Uncharacterized protein n=1 Tax=Fusarium phyllophilum TaxID=47803 RepID=A0A8H5JSF9_9HYPO|nr:hypothetical protein FPHYL_6417 [Fusarium phyllophilum]